MSEHDKVKQVLDNCTGCESQDIENCESLRSGLITHCLRSVIPTDEELALFAGAGQKVINRLKRKILDQVHARHIVNGYVPTPHYSKPYHTLSSLGKVSRPSKKFQYLPEPPQED